MTLHILDVVEDRKVSAAFGVEVAEAQLANTVRFAPGQGGGVVPSTGGQFLAFDAENKPIRSSGTGADAGLRTDLADPTGASLSGFEQGGAGAAGSSVQAQLRFFIRPEQFGALRNAVNDDQPAIMLADAFAAATGATVLFSPGVYRLRAKLAKSYKTSWRGHGNPFPVIISNVPQPNQAESGTQFMWDHGDNCVEMIGPGPYHQCGTIENIGIVGTGQTTGNGWVLDKVGSPRLRNLRVWSSHGDAFVFGVSAGDVTGQIHVSDLYANNPIGVCYRNRSKWLKATKIESDGGTYSLYCDNAPNADIAQFHFEGASNKAVVFAGANGNSRLRGGFIGLTNPASLKGVELQSAAGNTDITIENVQIIGHSALVAGIEVNSSAWRARIRSCEIQSAPVGVLDASDGTSISNTHFLNCAMGISAQGDHSQYQGNIASGTTGPCWLDHVSGGFGVWSDNVVDKPFRPTLYGGVIGNFGTNRVCNNSGYKTRTGGLTAGIASGTVIPHGLSVTPFTTDIRRLGAEDPAGLTWTYDATNIVPTWSGGGTMQFSWSARAVCEDA